MMVDVCLTEECNSRTGTYCNISQMISFGSTSIEGKDVIDLHILNKLICIEVYLFACPEPCLSGVRLSETK